MAESSGACNHNALKLMPQDDVQDGPLVAATLQGFLQELLPASRQFSDELLAAALELLLSAPVSLLPPQASL